MAVSLLCNEVCDLCIGKPALNSLPTTATVGEALFALRLCGETYLSVVSAEKTKSPKPIVGKICMVDVLCYLCDQRNIDAPVAALKNNVLALISKDAGGVRRVEPNSSILEALDAILDSGANSLVVPIRSAAGSGGGRKRNQPDLCWLTQEDLVRFFLNSIFLFSPLPGQSVTALGLVRPAALTLRPHDPALSALPLIRSALSSHTSVAVVTADNKLIGEISPSTLASCDETVAAAIASLSAADLMGYIDCSVSGVLPDNAIQAVKGRLREKGMLGMLDLMESEELGGILSPGLGSGSSSSSDEEAEVAVRRRKPRRMGSGSYSAKMGRRSEEAIVCHPGSSLVAVMVQALAHRVSYIWVVEEEDYGLVGVVAFRDVLDVFREQLKW